VTPEKRSLPLIERIYQAALEPPSWTTFTEEFGEAVGNAAVGFALQFPATATLDASVAMYSTGFTPEIRELREVFVEHARRGFPWEEARSKHFLGRFGLASEVFPDAKVAETDFYRDWMQPQGLAPVAPMGHTIAMEGGRPIASVALFRRDPGGPFRPRDLVLGDLLVPHLAQAYRIHAQVRESRALSEALDRLPTGVLLLDAKRQPVLANRSARYLLGLDDGLGLVEHGPRAASPAEDALLRRMIDEAISVTSTGKVPESNVMSVSRPSARRPFPLMVGPLLSSVADSALHDAVVVLFVTDLDAPALERGEVLRALYRLTHAEIELVELLCDGCTLEEAALRRGVTMNTARSQLKQIFVKTSTSRQSELVRLVLAGVAPIRNP